jgi:hypothetical protein
VNFDRAILILIWIVTILLMVLATPRKKIREALVIFMFKQVLTWVFGLIVVEHKLIEYPVREFPYAVKSSFSFEYFIYPAICIVFNLRFPEKRNSIYKIGWYLLFPTWMTLIEVLLENYTNLVHYIHWNWFYSWITLLVTFIISRVFYLWFMKKETGYNEA